MTDFLFAMPSFVSGMGRALDLGNTMTQYNFSDTPTEADVKALRSDWFAIGQDMRDAVNTLVPSDAKQARNA
jgi:hypothetical protein